MIRSHSTWIEIISDLQWSSVLIMLRVAAIYFTSKEVPIDLQLKMSLEEEEVVVNSPYLCGSPTKRSRFMDVIHSFNDTVVTCLSLYTFVLVLTCLPPPPTTLYYDHNNLISLSITGAAAAAAKPVYCQLRMAWQINILLVCPRREKDITIKLSTILGWSLSVCRWKTPNSSSTIHRALPKNSVHIRASQEVTINRRFPLQSIAVAMRMV